MNLKKKIKLNKVVRMFWEFTTWDENGNYCDANCHRAAPLYIDAKITAIIPSGPNFYLVAFAPMPYELQNAKECHKQSKILRFRADEIEFDGHLFCQEIEKGLQENEAIF